MKKEIILLTIIFVLTISSQVFAFTISYNGIESEYTGPNVTLILNDKVFKASENQMPPIIIGNRTLVPVREVFEQLGGTVKWEAETRKVIVTIDKNKVELTIDSNIALVNGEIAILDETAKIINNKTMVPVRFISEKCGLKVDWINDTKTVTIKKNTDSMTSNTNMSNIYESEEFKSMYEDAEKRILEAINSEVPDDDMKKIAEQYNVLDETPESFVRYAYFLNYFDDFAGYYRNIIPGSESAINKKFDELREEAIEKDINVSYPTIYYMIAENLTFDELKQANMLEYALPASKNNKNRMSDDLHYITSGLTRTGVELYRENIEKTKNTLIDSNPLYEIKDLSTIDSKYSNDIKWTLDGVEQKFYISAYGRSYMLPGYPVKLKGGATAYYINEMDYYIVVQAQETVYDEKALIFNEPIIGENFSYFNSIKNANDVYYEISYTSDYGNNQKVSKFESAFSKYLSPIISRAGSVRIASYSKGYMVNNANVLYYLISNHTADEVIKLYVENKLPIDQLPVGYKLPNKIKEALKKYSSNDEEEAVVAYLIDDMKVEGYDGSLFYGKNMNEEKHYITNTGDVITLPGLKVIGSDGTITYHISNLYSYTLEEGEKPITLKEKYGLDVNGNIID